MAMTMKLKRVSAATVDGLRLNVSGSSTSPPPRIHVHTDSAEKAPSSDVDNGVTRLARQTETIAVVMSPWLILPTVRFIVATCCAR